MQALLKCLAKKNPLIALKIDLWKDSSVRSCRAQKMRKNLNEFQRLKKLRSNTTQGYRSQRRNAFKSKRKKINLNSNTQPTNKSSVNVE